KSFSQLRNFWRSWSVRSQSRRSSTVGVWRSACRSSTLNSLAVVAAATPQMRPSPVPNGFIDVNYPQSLENRACSMPLQMCKASSPILLTWPKALVSFKGASPRTALSGVSRRSTMMMRANATTMCLGILLAAVGASAQGNAPGQVVSSTQAVGAQTSPDFSAVYCAGFVSDEKMQDDLRLISGEQSNVKIVFTRGDYVFINKGSNQGVRVGDRFFGVRPDPDPLKVQWFKWQDKLLKAMGTIYKDTGQLVVTGVQPNVSTAQVTF